jgi:hypothetical protein
VPARTAFALLLLGSQGSFSVALELEAFADAVFLEEKPAQAFSLSLEITRKIALISGEIKAWNHEAVLRQLA